MDREGEGGVTVKPAPETEVRGRASEPPGTPPRDAGGPILDIAAPVIKRPPIIWVGGGFPPGPIGPPALF